MGRLLSNPRSRFASTEIDWEEPPPPVRVELIEDPLMRRIRLLDKLVDELAKGKALEKVLRG